MRVLRFRIARVMVFVALAALNFTAIRAVSDYADPRGTLLGVGALPMANVLAVGPLIGYRSRRSRPVSRKGTENWKTSFCDEFFRGYGAENRLSCPDFRPNSTYNPNSTPKGLP